MCGKPALLPSKVIHSPKALAKGKASPSEKPASHLSGCQISPLPASPRRPVVMARSLGPREDVHLRTLSSSLGWLSGPEPAPSLCMVCRAIYQTTSLSSGVPSLLVTWAPVPHPYLSSRPPTGHHGHPITEPSSPSPGVFFLADLGATKEMGGPIACCLSGPRLSPSA